MNKCQNIECKAFPRCQSHTPVKEYIRHVAKENQACFLFSNKYRKEVDLDFGFVISFVILVSVAFLCYRFLTFHLNDYC